MNSKNKGLQKGGKLDQKSAESETMANQNSHEPTEKELILQKELEAVNAELQQSRKRVEELREENVWLQEEASRIRTENQEYMSYMDKKTNKRQSAVVSLNDYHRHQLMELQNEREIIEKEFSNNKQALQAVLMQKENEIAVINRELDGLHEYKILYEEQSGQIAELEREMLELRNKHSESIRNLKSSYVQEKRTFEQVSQARLDNVAKQANKEAMQCLSEHTSKVSEDNRRLRHELLTQIRQSQAMQAHKRRLLAQRQQLLLECQYSEDLRAIRGRGNNNNNNKNGNTVSNSNGSANVSGRKVKESSKISELEQIRNNSSRPISKTVMNS